MLVWLAGTAHPHFTFFNVFSLPDVSRHPVDHHRPGGGALDGAAPHPPFADPEVRQVICNDGAVPPQQEGHSRPWAA